MIQKTLKQTEDIGGEIVQPEATKIIDIFYKNVMQVYPHLHQGPENHICSPLIFCGKLHETVILVCTHKYYVVHFKFYRCDKMYLPSAIIGKSEGLFGLE